MVLNHYLHQICSLNVQHPFIYDKGGYGFEIQKIKKNFRTKPKWKFMGFWVTWYHFFKKIASKKFQALWMKKGCFWILIGRLVFLDHFMFYGFTNILKSTVLQFFTLIIFQKTFNYTHIVFFCFTTRLPHFYHIVTTLIPARIIFPIIGIHGPLRIWGSMDR